ncbi:hypothetical protein [Candidatus Enterovibrio escicola]|uniref:Uncharacterized protein n=1 Tax=Candidatus Enterovibrio escicola TaxID=1927127 RepID=A0A2A5T188_9GAMM|nr:hypothetical protein [Candidatus Enterovibrio escacola]PCS21927.1 hypothetical protein BTN49_2392 [Candidatus Enterovibrio escacola]
MRNSGYVGISKLEGIFEELVMEVRTPANFIFSNSTRLLENNDI